MVFLCWHWAAVSEIHVNFLSTCTLIRLQHTLGNSFKSSPGILSGYPRGPSLLISTCSKRFPHIEVHIQYNNYTVYVCVQ